MRVLIVEDEPITRRVIRRLLERENIEVVEAHTGTAALLMLEEQGADVIVSDVRMPGMTGTDLYHSLPEEMRRKVILFTSALQRPAVPYEVPVLDKRTDIRRIVEVVQKVARLNT